MENTPSKSCPQPEPASKAECPCDSVAPGPLQYLTSSPAGGCPQEWSQEDCECCPSGIVDIDGKCCFSTGKADMITVDAKGACCSAHVDACGVCGGDGIFLDRESTCCKVLHPDDRFCDVLWKVFHLHPSAVRILLNCVHTAGWIHSRWKWPLL